MAQHKIEEKHFTSGEYLFRENAECSALFIIKSGHIEISRLQKSGDRIPIGLVGPGEFLGESALLMSQRHSADAMAIDDVVATVLSAESMNEQINSAPTWLVALTRGLVTKLKHANQILQRNGIVDENLATQIMHLHEKAEKSKKS